MFLHYLTIAFRNMWKYKSQTVISLIGLAVGFTCFTLATLWIVYEMTYDSFHKNARQMYVVYRPDTYFSTTGYSRTTVNPLAAYLKETFPEIADAISLIPSYSGNKVTVNDKELPVLTIRADSSFFRMFDVKIIEGNWDFLINDSKNTAITQEKARQLFGDVHPIGETVKFGSENYTICAIVSGMSKRSNYAFDFIQPFRAYAVNPNINWIGSTGENTIIELVSGVNVEAFEKKLYEHNTWEEKNKFSKMTIKPITKIRYTDPEIEREVKFQYILIFAVSGLLVILCSLFNYLTLFVSRFRMRQKEFAMRVVFGARDGSLLAMLAVEFMLTLGFAVALGFLMTQWFHQPFLSLSEIQMSLPAIYRESLLYIGGIMIVSLLMFRLILFIFRRRSLNVSIRRSNKNLSRKTSVIIQLMISAGFAFCTIIMLKQIYFLHHTDELGFSFQNRGAISLRDEGKGKELANLLQQIPEIKEVVDAERMVELVPQNVRMGRRAKSWDNKLTDSEDIDYELMYVSPEYNAFYDFRLAAGEMLTDTDPDSLVLLNESAVKAFGWYEPVGKQFGDNNNTYTVKGVIKNVYNFAPTVQTKPVIYINRFNSKETMRVSAGRTLVLFKYREGMWKTCKEHIEQLMQKEFTGLIYTQINSEEEYNQFLKSENALIKLLAFVSAICVLICVFGFVSLVSLTCEERRKEIAIRKINGAMTSDILSMFTKEYSLLLVIGSAIAFSTGFFIMQRWLENYVKQTSIPAWICLSIVCVMALVIVLCVGWQTYKASVESPVKSIKN